MSELLDVPVPVLGLELGRGWGRGLERGRGEGVGLSVSRIWRVAVITAVVGLPSGSRSRFDVLAWSDVWF